MNVLSLFDGMSCGQIALKQAGFKVKKYFASEIDKYAMKVTQENFPYTRQLGDVSKIKAKDLPKIDLIIGGSPCQGFSFSGKQLNFNDERSALFFEMVRLIDELKPKYFLLENVRMKSSYEEIITQYMKVPPKTINSSLVSAQSRTRLYWTNIPNVTIPDDKNVMLDDILEKGVDPKYFVSEQQLKRLTIACKQDGGVKGCFKNPVVKADKSECLMARDYKGIPGRQNFTMCIEDGKLRKLTPIEYERLQTVPDDYTKHVSNTQRYKMLGNGWTVDVIAHIFKNMEFDDVG